MNAKLNISIHSFGYKRSGIPSDKTDNNGGFVFDCRGLPNPGRLPEFNTSSGLDLNVIEYLESFESVHSFNKLIKNLVQINIDNYIERHFTHLMISFGCTGGQHRSVYCAELLKKHLENDFTVTIVHHEKAKWSQ